jgi:hypothetical protein
MNEIDLFIEYFNRNNLDEYEKHAVIYDIELLSEE